MSEVQVRYPGGKYSHRIWDASWRLPIAGDTWLLLHTGGNNLLQVKEITWEDNGESVGKPTIFLEDAP